MNKLFLIDAYALIFRFYYAFIGRPMRNSKELNTSAIYGFTKFIDELLEREKPEYIGVAFDPKGGCFRKRLYPLYKSNRSETPEDIIASVPYIKQILTAMNIPILEVNDYEADDVIGTIAKKGAREGLKVYMVTPDKDYGQLIEDNIMMYKPRKGGGDVFEVVTKEAICRKYTIDDPWKVRDILALWGDVADNVPGVPGVGEKTAMKLMNLYGDIDGIYENIDKLKGKQKENLIAFKDKLALSRELVTICQDVPIELDLKALKQTPSNDCDLIEVFRELEFATMIRDIETRCRKPIQNINIQNNSAEPTLFDDFETETKTPTKTTQTESENIVSSDSFDLFSAYETDINTISNTPHLYTQITTQHEADALVELIKMKKRFCFDTETTGLNCRSDKLVGISIAIEKGKAYYIHNDGTIDISKSFKQIFESKTIEKIGQNIKFDILMLKSIGIEVVGKLYDTMIMQYILNPDIGNGLDFMARTILKYENISIETLIGSGSKKTTMDMVDVKKIVDYACEDADITLQLYEVLWKKVTQSGFQDLYFNIEEPLIYLLSDMEYVGVKLDNNILREYSVILTEELSQIEEKIRSYSEGDININSPKQLGELLFDKLKIIDNAKRTKTKQYKTDEESLQKLSDKHPIINEILEYREIKKLLSTYVNALSGLINSNSGRVHTTYNQALTRTGRLSSNNPNLQNIPIRTPRGEVIRKAFIAEGEDKVLLAADYSQIELRIMAHLSKDSNMIEAFSEGRDIHTATASKIYEKDEKIITKNERSNAKSANFGIIYGISSFGLATNLKISRVEAKELIDGYFRSYPKVQEYMNKSVERARERGYAETIYGRRRYLSDINSGNANIRSFAERNAINAPIQGSAADIMKLAMIEVDKRLREKELKSKIILQVHDEIVIEALKSEVDKVKEITISAMEGIANLLIPLPININEGKNWYDAH